MIILDTDCLSLLDREQNLQSSQLRNSLSEFEPDELFTAIITFEEQMRGWLSYIARCKSLDEQVFAYGRLHKFLESYRTTRVLDFTESAATLYHKLRSERIRVGTMDLKIAAIAIANNAILISRNLADFEQIPNLTVQDWTR
ncbi:MAG: PIN domain-containing protein [Acidobacteria bacterium]|nr:PIN domain-containing protein [Acidobacteriota bacterium]